MIGWSMFMPCHVQFNASSVLFFSIERIHYHNIDRWPFSRSKLIYSDCTFSATIMHSTLHATVDQIKTSWILKRFLWSRLLFFFFFFKYYLIDPNPTRVCKIYGWSYFQSISFVNNHFVYYAKLITSNKRLSGKVFSNNYKIFIHFF